MSNKVVYLTYKCRVCNRFLPQAQVFYDVVLEVKSGNNQLIFGGMAPEEIDRQLEDLIEQISETSPQKLDDEIFMRRTFHLCPDCRNKLLSWLNLL